MKYLKGLKSMNKEYTIYAQNCPWILFFNCGYLYL